MVIFAYCCLKKSEKEARNLTETTVIINAGGAGNMASDQGSPDDNEGSSLAIAIMEERMRQLFLDHKTMAQAEQDRALSTFRSHLDRLVKMIVQRELQVQRISIKTAADDGRVYLVRTTFEHVSLSRVVLGRCNIGTVIAHFCSCLGGL